MAPPSAGPMARATLMPSEFRATAARSSALPTSSGTTDWKAGPDRAAPIPPRSVRPSSNPGDMAPDPAASARARPTRSRNACTPTRNLRRSTTSASAPAGRDSRNTGRVVAPWTIATARGEGDSSVISQPDATSRTQVPVLDTSTASQTTRKARLLNGAQALGAGGAAAAARAPRRSRRLLRAPAAVPLGQDRGQGQAADQAEVLGERGELAPLLGGRVGPERRGR
jgi:hypothetical protein